MDKQSGKDFERPAYKRLLKKLKPGDTLVIKSIDRLGRDYGEILEQWRVITKERQAEGIMAARARGVKFGRPALERPEQFSEVRGAWERKEISAREASRRLGVRHLTFLSWTEQ